MGTNQCRHSASSATLGARRGGQALSTSPQAARRNLITGRDALPVNAHQELWWEQAKSDLAVLAILRSEGVPPCHQLHYLQMASEKIAKAFFWRSGTAPPRTHAGFVQFLRRLGSVPTSDRQRIADIFGFKRFDGFQNWLRVVLPIGYSLERLARCLRKTDRIQNIHGLPNRRLMLLFLSSCALVAVDSDGLRSPVFSDGRYGNPSVSHLCVNESAVSGRILAMTPSVKGS